MCVQSSRKKLRKNIHTSFIRIIQISSKFEDFLEKAPPNGELGLMLKGSKILNTVYTKSF